MGRLLDLTGQRFGRLTVLSRNGSDKFRRPLWLALCNCGTQKLVASPALRNSRIKSCGCLLRELKKEDLTGQAFGFLVVKNRAHLGRRPAYLVRCVCGIEKIVRREGLLSGTTKSCGCAANKLRKTKIEKKFNLTNMCFGKLRVISRSGSERSSDGSSHTTWECKCECGKIVKARTAALNNGSATSCGCMRNFDGVFVPSLLPGRMGFNSLLARYKRSALKRNISWELSDTKFEELVTMGCFYCGSAPAQVSNPDPTTLKGRFVYNGIDRKDSRYGYTEDNAVSCCGTHNQMKSTLSVEEFVASCESVVRHFGRIGIGAKA